jgi:hypothetical protein
MVDLDKCMADGVGMYDCTIRFYHKMVVQGLLQPVSMRLVLNLFFFRAIYAPLPTCTTGHIVLTAAGSTLGISMPSPL